MSLSTRNANCAFYTLMISLSAVCLALFVMLNIMMGLMIVRPIRRVSNAADKTSTGAAEGVDIAEFSGSGKDEIAVLSKSLNRIRRSLAKAIDLIDGG